MGEAKRFLTTAEFADKVGISLQTVLRALKDGRIDPGHVAKKSGTYRISSEAVLYWQPTTKGRRPANGNGAPEPVPAVVLRLTLIEAQTMKTIYEAELKKIEVEKVRGVLCNVEAVKEGATLAARTARKRLEDIPVRTGAEIESSILSTVRDFLVKALPRIEAGETVEEVLAGALLVDRHAVEQVIKAEVRTACEELSRWQSKPTPS